MNKTLIRKRVFALAIDCAVFLSIIIFTLSVVLLASNGIVSSWLTEHNLYGLIMYIPFMSMIVLKDVFGRSLGKRLLGLTIVDIETKHNISVYRRIARNITLFVLPVEVGFLLEKNLRSGDILAKTEVIEITYNKK